MKMPTRGFLAFRTEGTGGHRKVSEGLFEDQADARWLCPQSLVIEVALERMAGLLPSIVFTMLPGSEVTWPSTEARALITRADVDLIRDLARTDRLGGIIRLAKDGVLDRHVRDHS